MRSFDRGGRLGTVAVSAAAALLVGIPAGAAWQRSAASAPTLRVPPAAVGVAAVREAADAYAGAIFAGDPVGLCAMLGRSGRQAAENEAGSCVADARTAIFDFAGQRVVVGRVAVVAPGVAHVYELVDGAATVWTFHVEHGRWVLFHAALEPSA